MVIRSEVEFLSDVSGNSGSCCWVVDSFRLSAIGANVNCIADGDSGGGEDGEDGDLIGAAGRHIANGTLFFELGCIDDGDDDDGTTGEVVVSVACTTAGVIWMGLDGGEEDFAGEVTAAADTLVVGGGVLVVQAGKEQRGSMWWF